MKCKTVEQLISAHLDGEVTASDWREAQAHIEGCPRCTATLATFKRSTDLYQQELAPREPSVDLWAGVSERIHGLQQPSRASRRVERLKQLWEEFIFRPIPAIRFAQVGFVFAALLGFMLVQFQPKDGAELARTVEPEPMDRGGEIRSAPFAPTRPRREPRVQPVLADYVEKYLEKAGVLLLEVKNSDVEPDSEELVDLRQASQNLLEETILIKQDLKEIDLTMLKKTVEQLEMVLLDIANLSEMPENEEIDLLKAAIVQKDLLIKIEIYDAKKIEGRMHETAVQDKPVQQNKRPRI